MCSPCRSTWLRSMVAEPGHGAWSISGVRVPNLEGACRVWDILFSINPWISGARGPVFES